MSEESSLEDLGYRITSAGLKVQKLAGSGKDNPEVIKVLDTLSKSCIQVNESIHDTIKASPDSETGVNPAEKELRMKCLEELREVRLTLMPFIRWPYRNKLKRFEQLNQEIADKTAKRNKLGEELRDLHLLES